MRIDLHQSPVYQDQFRQLEERFRLLFENKDEFLELVKAGANFKHANKIDEKIALVNQGFFSQEILQFIISGGSSYKTGPIAFIWNRLVEAQVVIPTVGFEFGAFVNSSLMTDSLRMLLVTDTFQNVFYPPSNFLQRYKGALVKINAEANGKTSRGTGFVVRDVNERQDILITAKHNVDTSEGVVVKELETEAGDALALGKFRLHPDQDVASLVLQNQVEGPAFHLTDHIAVFDEVFTLGYPLLPLAESCLVGHRGELNGYTAYYQTGHPLMLISNLVSPGNSGCPILQRWGFVAGMTTRWLQGEYDEEKVRFSAGIPANVLIQHLNSAQ